LWFSRFLGFGTNLEELHIDTQIVCAKKKIIRKNWEEPKTKRERKTGWGRRGGGQGRNKEKKRKRTSRKRGGKEKKKKQEGS